ncbi:MAG: methylated-DNA--[protein]-cysteine S-methyltransferase [Flavobacteriales bacterium]|nr:methylated-DNA--[protein]-cysteine S-methyltransferase [Flavobacteriales bacterium]
MGIVQPELFSPLPVRAVDSPLGRIWLECDGERMTRLSFTAIGRQSARPPQVLHEAVRQLEQYFNGTRQRFDLPLTNAGSPFRRKVLKDLLSISYGRVRSYQEIAERVGGNARAVGGACAWNPLPILIPCHRVVSANGLLTGYIGGLWRKRWLLEHERAIPEQAP